MRTAKNRMSVLKIEPEIKNEVKGRGLDKTILEKKTSSREGVYKFSDTFHAKYNIFNERFNYN